MLNSLRNGPEVSVVTIFLNAEKFIQEAVESVRAQTYGRWELLLVDDGSTDTSTEIARRLANTDPERIRYLEHEGHRNRGMSASRNLGIRNSIGKYIAFLDADDVWLPDKLERQVAILDTQPRAAMVYGPTQYWYSWTGLPEDIDRDCIPELGVQRNKLFEPPELLTILYPLGIATAPCLCSLLVRRSAFITSGGFEESFKGYYEDQAFLTKLYLNEPVYVSDGCWDRYRIHADSCSAAVNRTGEYNMHRKRFLDWLEKYFRMEGVTDPKVWQALEAGRRRPGFAVVGSGAEQEALRLLRVTDENKARLEFPEGKSETVRIAISKAESEKTYDIQLNQPRLAVRAGNQYLIAFSARADSPRTIGYGFAQARAPWNNLGFYSQIDLLPHWQAFEGKFEAKEDEENGRIHFDVGGSNISVDLSSVTLRDLSQGGEIIKPRLLSPQTTQLVKEPRIEVGDVQFGSLRRVTPISPDFGCDRGRPIDRYYIENFLANHAEDVRGRVLEIGENTYTRKYGRSRVLQSDILHVIEGNPEATIIADLATGDHIPSNSFDCVILTQTLQLIYDVRAALHTIYRILKPGGVLLATFPGISQTYDSEWGDTWYWNFTRLSARRLFEEVFPPVNVKIETFGNVLAATSFLHGIAVEELSAEELDYHDPGYEVTITVKAVKPIGVLSRTHNEPRTRSSRSANSKAIILMYHRVSEEGSDPWGIRVTPNNFAAQLEVLRRYTQVIRLRELVEHIAGGAIPKSSVVVTFDDGYADNLVNAKPLLEYYDIPATIFLATGYLGQDREFWWDELEKLILQSMRLPETVGLRINGQRHQWELGDAAQYSSDDRRQTEEWKAWESAPSARHQLYVSLWQLLQPMSEAERQKIISDLRTWANYGSASRPTHRTLSAEEVCSLARGELLEIGCHSVTHSILSSLSSAAQESEIRESKQWVEDVIGGYATSFSYPYGGKQDYTRETINLVRGAGFACACSTTPTPVTKDSDLFELPRFQAKNLDADEFAYQLSLWFDD